MKTKEQLETDSRDHTYQFKDYESPKIKHHLVDVVSSLLAQSAEKTVNDKGMKEQWQEEEFTDTFTWE